MFRKNLLWILFTLCTAMTTFAQGSRSERVIASYMIAFGRPPQPAEINYWLTDPLSLKPVSDLVEKHRENMNRVDRSLRLTAVKQSYIDAFGRAPRPDEVDYWMGSVNTYAEMRKKHVEWFAARPDEWSKVIQASYQTAFKRAPKAGELAYWKGQPARSFWELVVQHDEFIRNNPNLGPKSGSGGAALVKKENKVIITPSLLNEIRLGGGAGVISTGGGNVISTGGGNVISTGGGNVISTGGGN
ncbi:MAG TPA: hypothetical protein VGE66_00580 [Chitinophagaceae bacterium]